MLQYGADALGSGFEDLESDTELIRVRKAQREDFKVCLFHFHERQSKRVTLSIRVLLVYLGLQDLLVPRGLTCQVLGQLEAHFQGILGHLDTLVGMDFQATQDYQ